MPSKSPTIIFLNINTTGYHNPDLVQIGAMHSWGYKKFNTFVMPDKPIEKGATKHHGISKGDDGKSLYRDGKRIKNVVDVETGLSKFVDWLSCYKNGVILVAHQANFHVYQTLIPNLKRCGIALDQSVIKGVCDSIDLCRLFSPETKKQYKLYDMLKKVNYYKKKSGDSVKKAEACRILVRRMAAIEGVGFLKFIRQKQHDLKRKA